MLRDPKLTFPELAVLFPYTHDLPDAEEKATKGHHRMIYAGALPPNTVKTLLYLTMATPLDQNTVRANYKVLERASTLTLEYSLGLWKRIRLAQRQGT